MDVNSYALEVLVRDRISEMHAAAARSSRIRAARRESRTRRTALGRALDRVRQGLHAVAGSSRMATGSRHGAVRG